MEKKSVNRRLHHHEKQSRGRQAMAGQRQPRAAVYELLHAQLPQQERLPGGVAKVKELQTDSCVDERGLIAPWPAPTWRRDDLWSGSAPCPAQRIDQPQALAQSRQQLAQARDLGMPEECIRVLGWQGAEGMRQRRDTLSPRPRGWTRREPDFVELSTRGEKAQEAMLKAQGELRASAARGRTGPTRLAQAHAGSPIAGDASSTSQREPGQFFGSFDRDHRKHVEPRRRSTTRAPDTRNPGVEGNSPDVISDLVPGGRRSFGHRIRRGTRPRALGSGRRRSRGDGRLRGGACSRWAACRSDSVKGTQSCNGEYTDNTTAEEEDAHRSANGCGAGWSPVLAGQEVVSTSYDEPQRHGTFGVVATCMCDHPSIWQVPEILHHDSLHRSVGLAPARTRGDTGRPAVTRLAGTQARDR